MTVALDLSLPVFPQARAVTPSSTFAEVREVMPDAFDRAIAATTPEEYDVAMEELVELEHVPLAPIDIEKVFAAFGPANDFFVRSLGDFVAMRSLVPFGKERDFDGVLRRTREMIYSMAYSLEYSRILLKLVEATLGLHALLYALHVGKEPTAFFTTTLAERLFYSTRDARQQLEAIHHETASSAMPPETVAKIKAWAEKGQDGVYRPFGEFAE